MVIEVRPVRPEEHDEAGAVVADAYRELVRPGDQGWDEYLQRLGDVAGRAVRREKRRRGVGRLLMDTTRSPTGSGCSDTSFRSSPLRLRSPPR